MKKSLFGLCLLFIVFLPLNSLANTMNHYLIGSGIHDITGPAAEVGMMGYAELSQITQGLRQRLFARAFVIEDPQNNKRVVFVSADLGQSFSSIKQGVVKRLQQLGYGTKYFDENLMISVTHSHSGPGGYSHDALFNLTTKGFIAENYNAIVNGITLAIIQADKNTSPGTIRYNEDKLYNTSENRSPDTFYANPIDRRSKLAGDETDKTMRLLRFTQDSGVDIGLINWFAVHGVSMSKNNKLITGDNKGYASYLFEKAMGNNYLANRTFVAAFAQANEGDVTSNLKEFNLANGEQDFYRLEIIGTRQYEKAQQLFNTASQELYGKIDYRLRYIDMSQYEIRAEFGAGQRRQTCPSALGMPFTRGTSDGGGSTIEDGLLKFFGYSIIYPEQTDVICQAPKDIFLLTGKLKPHPWLPNIIPVQIIRIGTVALVGVPGELTTVAGEQLRTVVADTLGNEVNQVIIAGLANSYTGYITTREEYEQQKYEGSFTVYGPWTLNAYLQAFHDLADDLHHNKLFACDDNNAKACPRPAQLEHEQITLQTGVVVDSPPIFGSFGQVFQDVNSQYQPGTVAEVIFWGAHPKNYFYRKDKNTQDTFLFIQKREGNQWINIANDNDWSTLMIWQREGISASKITIRWNIPENVQKGHYRIMHQGWEKQDIFSDEVKKYVGYSSEFTVN
jgi:neutral ceramidase